MHINLTGHHVEITTPLRDYVNSKFRRLLQHVDNIVNVHVVLSIAKLEQKADATIQLGGATLYADMVHDDMYAAIDGLIDRIDRQLVKHKEKTTDHHRSEGAALKGPLE
ncbi:MAG TPA: ribosome-associated translation inhibitor RaiA [Gammaproteobacteria bacterium]|jgi:putative sigma-54 modulation protein|nr:ribosome-associated translation inhibitor RaiA [Gammaproteobacteria bacterium]